VPGFSSPAVDLCRLVFINITINKPNSFYKFRVFMDHSQLCLLLFMYHPNQAPTFLSDTSAAAKQTLHAARGYE
jgi:hypothetical protein